MNNLIKKGFVALILALTSVVFSQDLVMTNMDHSMKGYVPGYTLKMYYEEANLGSVAVNDYLTVFCLSKDTLVGNDINLRSVSNSLSANTKKTSILDITFPEVEPGKYYLLASIDYNNSTKETNESNNIKWIPCTMMPNEIDLELSRLRLTYLPTANKLSGGVDVRNVGNTNVFSYYIDFYISNDSILSDSYTKIYTYTGGATTGSSLNIGDSLAPFFSNISNTTKPGTYYFIARVWMPNLGDKNEANNMIFQKIQINPASIDLKINSVSISTPTRIYTPNEGFMGYVSESNMGNGDVPITYVGFYFSKDTVKDASDVLLTTTGIGAFQTGSNSYNMSISIPANAVPGKYYIIAMADFNNTVTESNESNNFQITSIEVVPTFIDLKPLPMASASPADIRYTSGKTYNQSFWESNQGSIYAAAHTTQWFLSADTVLSASDSLIGTVSVPSIAMNKSVNLSIPIRIPANTAMGSYYVIIVADVLNKNIESDKANNTLCIPVKIGVPETDIYNSRLTIYTNAINTGEGVYVYTNEVVPTKYAVNVHQTGFFLSKDSVYSSDDLLIGSNSLGSNEDKTSATSARVTVPLAKAAGDYYLIAFHDYLNDVAESNESNNTAHFSLKVITAVTDLNISALSSPAIVTTSKSFTVTFTENNLGSLPAPAHQVGFYVSKDSILSVDDTYINSVLLNPLAAYSSYASSMAISIPASVVFGDYYLLAANDYKELVNEGNENNNVKAFSISLRQDLPDIFIKRFTLPKTEFTNAVEYCTIDVELSNLGTWVTSEHGGIPVGCYLSKDTVQSADDSFAGYVTYDRLLAYQTRTTITAAPITKSLAPGEYYLILKADFAGSIRESDENNNFKFHKISIIQSVTELNLTVFNKPKVVKADWPFDIGYRLKNEGNTALSGITTTVYLSNDNVHDVSDKEVYNFSLSLYNGGDSSRAAMRVTLPAATPLGNYYLIIATDSKKIFTESNETNNIKMFPVEVITAEYYDMMMKTPINGPLTYISNEPKYFRTLADAINKNMGTLSCTQEANFYLSKDTVWDANDYDFRAFSSFTTYPGDSLGFNFETKLPKGTAPGIYYILYVADHRNRVLESNESNNIAVLKIVVTGVTGEEENIVWKRADREVHIYPNPSQGVVHISDIDDLKDQVFMDVYNASGILLYTTPYDDVKGAKLASLSPGLYIVNIRTAYKSLQRERLVIEE